MERLVKVWKDCWGGGEAGGGAGRFVEVKRGWYGEYGVCWMCGEAAGCVRKLVKVAGGEAGGGVGRLVGEW